MRTLSNYTLLRWKAFKAASETGALLRNLSFTNIGGFVFSAVLLPGDVYALVIKSMELDASRKSKKDKDQGAVRSCESLQMNWKRICQERMSLFDY